MAKYKLTPGGGVSEPAMKRAIPDDPKNRHWREYQAWLAEGNTPDPADVPPPPTSQQILDMSDKKMIRAVDWLLEFVVTQGRLPTLPDIPVQLKQLYLERKQARES